MENKNNKKGFTLIEVVTVLVVVLILSTITIGQFSQFIAKAHFAKAQSFEAQLKRKMLLSIDSYVAFWTFSSDFGGTQLTDGSSQENHIPLPPEIEVVEEAHSVHADPYALSFDGTGTGLSISGNTLIPKNKITISVWFKLNRHKNYNQIYRYVDSRILIRVANNKKLCFNMGDGGLRHNACAAQDIELDQWYHVGAVYDGEIMQLYLDGIVVAETPFSNFNLNPTNSTQMWLGRGNAIPGSIIDGYLDNVYVWGDSFKWD